MAPSGAAAARLAVSAELDVDVILRRVRALAQELAADRQAISTLTAQHLVHDIALSEGLHDVPDSALAFLAHELQSQIQLLWD